MTDSVDDLSARNHRAHDRADPGAGLAAPRRARTARLSGTRAASPARLRPVRRWRSSTRRSRRRAGAAISASTSPATTCSTASPRRIFIWKRRGGSASIRRSCLALEDSPTGARAAVAAGMVCYAVPDPSHYDRGGVRAGDAARFRQPARRDRHCWSSALLAEFQILITD